MGTDIANQVIECLRKSQVSTDPWQVSDDQPGPIDNGTPEGKEDNEMNDEKTPQQNTTQGKESSPSK